MIQSTIKEEQIRKAKTKSILYQLMLNNDILTHRLAPSKVKLADNDILLRELERRLTEFKEE